MRQGKERINVAAPGPKEGVLFVQTKGAGKEVENLSVDSKVVDQRNLRVTRTHDIEVK